jgi:hypothetical protein
VSIEATMSQSGHVSDFGRRLTLVRDVANSGHVSRAPKPTLMTHQRHGVVAQVTSPPIFPAWYSSSLFAKAFF